METSRREFLEQMAGGLLSVVLADLMLTRRAVAKPFSVALLQWLRKIDELAQAVSSESITQPAWQTEMESLLAQVDLPEFLRCIDFDNLSSSLSLPATGESFRNFRFPLATGLLRPAFYRDLAGFHRGASIPPHGHNHLVSSFLVLRGELRGRHFDRLRDEGDRLKISPTVDRVFKAGDFSTVSQFKDNVHWFTAQTEGAFIFDFGVGGLAPAGTTQPLPNPNPLKSGRLYLDVEAGALQPDGSRLAPRISEAQAYRVYG